MKKLLLATLLATTAFNASAFVKATDQERADTSPWFKVGTGLYATDSFNAPEVTAYLYKRKGHPSVKFSFTNDMNCHKFGKKHKVAKHWYVNGRPVGMTKQCVGNGTVNYESYSNGGDKFLVKQFKNSDIVYLDKHGKKHGAIKFSTKGFNHELNRVKAGK